MDEEIRKLTAVIARIEELHIQWAMEAANWVSNDPMDADVLRDAVSQLRRSTELATLLKEAR